MTFRPAAVAGSFYQGNPEALASEINRYLRQAQQPSAGEPLPKAVLVPHAGYRYCGTVAASAYAMVAPGKNVYRRVVLLGPVHRFAIKGLAVSSTGGFTTPLGIVPLDLEAIARLEGLPGVVVSDQAHAQEHSLEVQLPFLQTVLTDFSLVPLAAADVEATEVARVLDLLWGGSETLIVVSSDLSHYLSSQEARRIDGQTARSIVELQGPIGQKEACGASVLNGFLLACQSHGLRARLLDLRNSGDTSGEKSRVVGYGAFAFYPGHPDGT